MIIAIKSGIYCIHDNLFWLCLKSILQNSNVNVLAHLQKIHFVTISCIRYTNYTLQLYINYILSSGAVWDTRIPENFRVAPPPTP